MMTITRHTTQRSSIGKNPCMKDASRKFNSVHTTEGQTGKPMRKPIGLLFLLVAFAFTSGCTMTSTSRQWHARVGPNGKPIYIKSHTNIGFNIGIIIPIVGRTTLPKEIDRLTEDIATEQGDDVRLIETSTANYWYGWPPFTWVVTPVITTVTADYEPSPDQLAKDLAEQEKKKAAKQKK